MTGISCMIRTNRMTINKMTWMAGIAGITGMSRMTGMTRITMMRG